jgi:ubiquinol-cytochrome c reductase cytochrome c1 subunit
MRLIFTLTAALMWCAQALAAGGHGPAMQPANIDLSDKLSLQRGARVFVNYCVSCHSAAFMRYNRIAEDLDLSEESVQTNLMFTTDKIGDGMVVAMRPSDAESWFGAPPPDLSVVARARGSDWLYNFLLTFYVDEKKSTGVNNLFFKDTAMPHVLWELQGLQRAVYHTETTDSGQDVSMIDHLELVERGSLTENQYKRLVRDLVGFLVYVGEPAKLVRHRIGFWVIVFLAVFLVAAYLMKREYWKDVH